MSVVRSGQRGVAGLRTKLIIWKRPLRPFWIWWKQCNVHLQLLQLADSQTAFKLALSFFLSTFSSPAQLPKSMNVTFPPWLSSRSGLACSYKSHKVQDISTGWTEFSEHVVGVSMKWVEIINAFKERRGSKRFREVSYSTCINDAREIIWL